MSSYFNALVWITLAAQVVTWPAVRVHQATGGLMRLPLNERAIVEGLLRPQLGPLIQGEDPGLMNKAMQSFRVERLNLAGTSALAVQANGNDFCGAAGGNCTFWIIDLHRHRVLLHADGIQMFAVEQHSMNKLADVITRSQASAFEGELIRWQFVGGIYRPSDCATEENADPDGNPLPEPKVTPHPCSSEGN